MNKYNQTKANIFVSSLLAELTQEFGSKAIQVSQDYHRTIATAYTDGLTPRQAVNKILWLKADRTVRF